MYRGAVGIRKSPVIRGTAAIAMGGVDVEWVVLMSSELF